jgi:hypothetical protein
MRARAAATPIALLLFACLAVGYAYFVDRAKISDADRAVRPSDVFPNLRVDAVDRVELEQGADSLVLERDGPGRPDAPAGWSMTSPRRDGADPTAVDVLLRELELATRLRDVDESAASGLDHPRVRGRLRVGPLEYRFALGADAPHPQGAAYLRVEGEGTFVVGQSLKVQLLRGTDAYRNRIVVPWAGSEVVRLEVRREDRGFTLERHGASFRVTETGLRASRTSMDHLLVALADARADTFLDDSENMDGPSIGVTLASRDPSRPSIDLRLRRGCKGQPHAALVARTRPTRLVACTSSTLVEALDVGPESLVDEATFFAHADEIEQVLLERIAQGGERVDLARKGTGWRERSPEDRDLDSDESESANGLALALANARTEDRPRLGDREVFIARDRVTLVRSGGGTSEIVELAAPRADETVLARRLDDGALLRLSHAVGRRFEPHPVALRARAVWRTPFDPSAVVAIDNRCSGTGERLEFENGVWRMSAPAGFATDPSAIAGRCEAFAHAKVDAWIAERDDGDFGLDRPDSCTVTLTLAEASPAAARRTVSFVFGGEGDDGIYARTLDDPAVFVAPRVLRDLFSHPAVDGNRLRLDPSALSTVVLTHGAERLVLEHAGEHLARRGIEDAAGDPDSGGRLESALEELYAEAAVHVGPARRAEGMDRPTLEITARPLTERGSGGSERRITIGAAAQLDAHDVFFARASGVDATFAVPKRAVSHILEAW